MPRKREDPAVRFWRHVVKDPSGCWLWTGAEYRDTGYGAFNAGDGRIVGAHAFAWEIAHAGVSRYGFSVRHTCDTPLCVNPEHLILGTQKANVDDMDAKGRRRPGALRGSDHHSAKLTEEKVLAARALARQGWSTRKLAAMYGVSDNTMSAAIRGRTWRHARVPDR